MNELFSMVTTQDGAREAEAKFAELSVKPTSTAINGLDGSSAAWIVAATLGTQQLPAVLNFVKDMLLSKRVKRIKVGDIEIENPSPEDLVRMRQLVDLQIGGQPSAQSQNISKPNDD